MNKGKVSNGGRLAFVLLTVLASAIFIGCGGSGGGTATGTATSGTQLSGNAAVRAAALSSVQSVSAGIGYPFEALQVAAPSGSKVPFGVGSSLRSILAVAKQMRTTTKSPQGNLTYISEINLYVGTPVIASTTITIPFFTDSAGANSAGNVVVTIPAGTTNYASYPATDTIAINVTGGDLAATGNLQVVFKDATGANTITGTVTMGRTGVVENLNMSLDDSFNVSGSVTIQESNATVNVTNMAGGIAQTLTCNVAVSPTNLSGTGTLNLLTGVVSMNLKTPTGNASALIDANGNLVLTYADASTETVSNPNNSGLTTGTGTSTSTSTATGTATATSTSTGTTAAYQAPSLVVSNANNTYGFNYGGSSVNANGDFLMNNLDPQTHVSTSSLVVLNSALTSPIALAGGALGYTLNAKDVVGGAVGNYWASPTAPLQTLSLFATGFQNIAGAIYVADSGIIVSGTGYYGYNNVYNGPTPDVVYFTATNAPPQRVTVPTSAINVAVSWMAPGGGFVGVGSNNADPATLTSLVYWASNQAAGTVVALPPSAVYIQTLFVNDAGQIAGTIDAGASFPSYYWSGPAATPTPLLGLGGANDNSLYIHGISAGGIIVGEDSGSGSAGAKAVRWVNGKVQDLNTLIPSGTGWVLEKAEGISPNGIIVGTGKLNGVESVFQMKPVPGT